MSPIEQVLLLVVNTVGSLFTLVVLLRFLLQLVRADFYNPISQFIVKATNPVLVPMRRMVPSVAGLDTASLILSYAAQVIYLGIVSWMLGIPLGPQLLIWAMIGWLGLFINIYFFGLLIMVIASWIAPNSYNPVLILINQILEPVMRPIRSKMPDMGGLDLSPLIFILALQIFEILLLTPLMQMAQVPGILAQAVIGL